VRLTRSLFSRLVMTQFFLVLAFQVLAMLVANSLIILPLLHNSVRDLSGLIALSAQDWSAQTPAQRPQFAAQLRRDYELELHKAITPLVSAPGLLPYGRALQTALRERFGQDAHVRLENQNEATYVLDIPTRDGRLRISFPQRRVGTYPYIAVMLSFGLSASLGLVVAIALARRLTHPLRKLNAAAQQVGAGQRPQHLDTNGVAELDTLAQSFNQMGEEVQRLLNNRTTLLAGVSHDLRSPIARMRMALELAQPRLEPQQYASMERYLEQMNQLITDYLNFAQGGTRRSPQTIDLAQFLQALCHETSSDAPPQFSGVSLIMQADPLALERVVGNLLDNALRYGAPPITVTLQQENQQAVITVSDCGPGIPPVQRETVFEPFTRIESSRNIKTGGTGLGLAIVREICRCNGWQVKLLGNPAQGTTARLVLPLHPPPP
jgi:two-component system, OmpR family, osmolarity sensor histidine kinase EnvZ